MSTSKQTSVGWAKYYAEVEKNKQYEETIERLSTEIDTIRREEPRGKGNKHIYSSTCTILFDKYNKEVERNKLHEQTIQRISSENKTLLDLHNMLLKERQEKHEGNETCLKIKDLEKDIRKLQIKYELQIQKVSTMRCECKIFKETVYSYGNKEKNRILSIDLVPVVECVLRGVDPDTMTMRMVRRNVETHLGIAEKSIDIRKNYVKEIVSAWISETRADDEGEDEEEEDDDEEYQTLNTSNNELPSTKRYSRSESWRL